MQNEESIVDSSSITVLLSMVLLIKNQVLSLQIIDVIIHIPPSFQIVDFDTGRCGTM
jgi:hypothetical protein